MDKRLLTEINRTKEMFQHKLGSKPITDQQVIEEGAKDWIIGATLLITSILAPRKAEAQIASIPDGKSNALVTSIQSITQDESKMDEIANYLHDKGYQGNTNAIKSTIVRNANKMVDKIESMKDVDSTDVVNTSDPQKVRSLLGKGYVITQAEIQTLIDTVYKDVQDIPVDTTTLNGSSEDFFPFATLILKPEIRQELSDTVEDILASGNKITNIRIIAGTDSVPIQVGGSLWNVGIHSNADLCNARADVIKDYLDSLGLDTSIVTVCTYPNNVENKPVGKPNDKLRIASVEITSVNIEKGTENPIDKINKTQTADFELTNISGGEKHGVKSLGSGKLNKSSKTNIINKLNLGKPIKCPSFGGDPTKF
jgi:outer membrane protein OmpA-like peptidoglycan-associated protein